MIQIITMVGRKHSAWIGLSGPSLQLKETSTWWERWKAGHEIWAARLRAMFSLNVRSCCRNVVNPFILEVKELFGSQTAHLKEKKKELLVVWSVGEKWLLLCAALPMAIEYESRVRPGLCAVEWGVCYLGLGFELTGRVGVIRVWETLIQMADGAWPCRTTLSHLTVMQGESGQGRCAM